MTATDPRTLDTLLAATEPVDAEPFDLDRWLLHIGFPGSTEAEMLHAREQIARHVNAERVRTENARRVACNLEADAARVDARIKEAVALLSDALLWHNSETDNTAVACQEALALLTGDA